MGGVRDPMTVIMSGGNGERMLQDAATLQFVSAQRGAKERALAQLMAAEQQAQQERGPRWPSCAGRSPRWLASGGRLTP